MAVADILLLMIVANSTPVLARNLLGVRWDQPIDGGAHWRDGRRVLGESKTWRGLVCAIAATTAVAPLLGLPWTIGLAAGTLSMTGDALASFVKRRLGYERSAHAPLLDTFPEALLPALGLRRALGLGWWDVLLAVALFHAIVRIASPILYRLHIRRRPW